MHSAQVYIKSDRTVMVRTKNEHIITEIDENYNTLNIGPNKREVANPVGIEEFFKNQNCSFAVFLRNSQSPAKIWYAPEDEKVTSVKGVASHHRDELIHTGFQTRYDLKAADQNELSSTVSCIGRALAARIKADVGDVGWD